MARDRKKKGEADKKPEKNDFKSFLKKRAPIYLGLIALFVVFVVPELTKGDLQSSLPALSDEEQRIVDTLMGYSGPNESGLTVMEAIAGKIDEEYPGEKIYNDKNTKVSLVISDAETPKVGVFRVVLDFESHKGVMNYDWDVDMNSGEITANNPESKHIIGLVDFYD